MRTCWDISGSSPAHRDLVRSRTQLRNGAPLNGRASCARPTQSRKRQLTKIYSRIQIANGQFRMDHIPGWLSDRGMVYVALGEPDQVVERNVNGTLTTTQMGSTTRLQ